MPKAEGYPQRVPHLALDVHTLALVLDIQSARELVDESVARSNNKCPELH